MAPRKPPKRSPSTKLLWPSEGEVVLSCAHGDVMTSVDLYALLRPVRVQSSTRGLVTVTYYLLCHACRDLNANGAKVSGLLTKLGTWSPPEGVAIPRDLAPLH